MGKIIEKIKITNDLDLEMSLLGYISPDEVRKCEVDALIDTGATLLVLPQEVVEQLGLRIVRRANVRYADNRRAEKSIAKGALLEIAGREATVDCIVQNKGTQPLVGQVPIEVMDLVIDLKNRKIAPSPESPDMPLLDLL